MERAAIEFLLRIGVQKPALFFKSYFNKGLYYRVNNAYSINKTLIKNDIDIIMINFNIENKICYLAPALLNNSLIKRCKLKVLLISR